MEKHLLRKIAGGVVRDARQQDRVYESREARVQFAEGIAISRLRGPDDRRVIGQKLPCSRLRIAPSEGA
jgi:hypothetical protein